jgi:hypothetical protein
MGQSGVISLAASTAALATDLLGFYIGGSVGEAHVRIDTSTANPDMVSFGFTWTF